MLVVCVVTTPLRKVSCLFDRKVLCDVKSVQLCVRSVRWPQSGEMLRKVANRRKSRKIGALCGEKYISDCNNPDDAFSISSNEKQD